MSEFEIITLDELNEIRRIWINEKYEIEDLVPKIYEEITGREFPVQSFDQSQPYGEAELKILKNDVCKGNEIRFSLLRNLLEIERRYRSSRRRAGLLDKLEDALKKGAFENENEALEFAIRRRDNKQKLEKIRDRDTDIHEFQSIVSEFKN